MNKVLEHITDLMNKRDWKLNYLAQRADVPQSTLSGLYQRNNVPSIPTLEKLCTAFGITLSEFFASESGMIALTGEQRRLLDSWDSLSDQHKSAVWALLEKLQPK